MGLEERIKDFKQEVNAVGIDQKASIKNKKYFEDNIKHVDKILEDANIEHQIYLDAIEVLRQVSDQSVVESYEFISNSVNTALSRVFKHERRIKLQEFNIGQNPQLAIKLFVQGDRERSLKLNTGRGLTNIVSLLSILCIIVITGSRRIFVMDEVISGLSARSLEIISDIMWNFTEIGFQFIVNEHGFVPEGAKVYYLENQADIGRVVNSYIEAEGVYIGDSIEKSQLEGGK